MLINVWHQKQILFLKKQYLQLFQILFTYPQNCFITSSSRRRFFKYCLRYCSVRGAFFGVANDYLNDYT